MNDAMGLGRMRDALKRLSTHLHELHGTVLDLVQRMAVIEATMSGEPESNYNACRRLLIIGENMTRRFVTDDDTPTGVAGLHCDIAAIRIILNKLERVALHQRHGEDGKP